MSLTFATCNDRIINAYRPFLVCSSVSLAHFDTAPFGLAIPEGNVVNPLRMESEIFLHLLQRLDRLTFGPEGMPMPRWVFFDCAELPGGIFGFAKEADALSGRARKKLEVPRDYHGLVPFSMYIAIPMFKPGCWLGHNLASLNRVFPEEKLGGLGRITKGIALKVFRAAVQYGASQWDSVALYIHARFGPLDLLTAYTPAHSFAATFTYRFAITDECLRAACGDPEVELSRPQASFYLDTGDEKTMQELQAKIEAGDRFCIVGPPKREGDRVTVPIAWVS